MLGKLLLTLLMLLGAYAVYRSRGAGEPGTAGPRPSATPLLPRRTIARIAAVVVGVMVLGSALALLRGWQHQREVVRVQLINISTGAIQLVEARRGDVAGRGLKTLDGRQIRLADVERMIILPALDEEPRSDTDQR